MSNAKMDELLRERARLLEELGKQAWLLQGTWIERYSTCVRPGCKCHQEERHGPRHYVAVMRDGRQRQSYVRRKHEILVREGLRQGQEIDRLLQQITDINLELLKEGAYDDVRS
ncbi:MAG: hypothetical protein QM270_05630 [Bacillota bacterium]|nr:hypothetical protein [Bacillota bacterium]